MFKVYNIYNTIYFIIFTVNKIFTRRSFWISTYRVSHRLAN